MRLSFLSTDNGINRFLRWLQRSPALPSLSPESLAILSPDIVHGIFQTYHDLCLLTHQVEVYDDLIGMASDIQGELSQVWQNLMNCRSSVWLSLVIVEDEALEDFAE